MFRDFPTFSRACIFSLLSLLTFSTSVFLPGSASSWLCFSSVHIVATSVSKLPSITIRNDLELVRAVGMAVLKPNGPLGSAHFVVEV